MQQLAKKLSFSLWGGDTHYWTLLGGIFALALRAFTAQPAVAQSLTSGAIGEILSAGEASVMSARPVQPAGPAIPPPVHQALLEVCQARGYGEDCARTLLGMAFKESRFDGDAIGDDGKARGYFQIHYKMHKVSLGCAEDLRCSADWTISYLESNGYPKNPKYAIQCHNGCGANNGYAASVIRNGKRLWPTAEAKVVAVK